MALDRGVPLIEFRMMRKMSRIVVVRRFPDILSDAMASGVWRNPGSERLCRLLNINVPDLELFESKSYMLGVAKQLKAAGYVEDPEFCFRCRERERTLLGDPRLIFKQTLFIGGSTMPGDDVFIAVDLGDARDLTVYVFSWDRSVPSRWVATITLAELIRNMETIKS